MTYWLFQANPKYHRTIDAIRAFDEMPWLVTRYRDQMQTNDGVLIWIAGANAGIYAIATIISIPEILPTEAIADLDYWTEPIRVRTTKPRTTIRFIRKLIGQPLRKTELRFDRTLRDLPVIKSPSSTNFKITPEQWQRVHQLKG
jgi:predicted RNA-binding protein with PUA-like domain